MTSDRPCQPALQDSLNLTLCRWKNTDSKNLISLVTVAQASSPGRHGADGERCRGAVGRRQVSCEVLLAAAQDWESLRPHTGERLPPSLYW